MIYRTPAYAAAPAVPKRGHLSVVAPAGEARRTTEAVPAREASDARLLAAVAQRRDEAAFEQLYAGHRANVVQTAQYVCRNKAVAEDIAQRTFMTLWERAERLASKGVRVRPWLTTVARNAAIDYVRSHAAPAPLAEAPNAAGASDPQEIAIANASLAELRRALETLPAQQRSVIDMRYFGGLTFAAIAAATGEPLGTVKSRAYLALGRLRGCVE